MKITEIKTYPVWVGQRNQMIVKVETDEGLHGWGEAGVSGREMAVVGAVRHYAEFLIGRDPLRMGALWQEMYRSQYFEGGRILTGAISAIDIALYDIAGKALNVPVYQLLGGKQREWVPCFATTGGSSQEEFVENVKLLADLGWPAIRTGFHPGRKPDEPDSGLRATRVAWQDGAVVDGGAGGNRTGAGAGHRLPPSPERGGSGIILPAHADGNAGFPGGADPGRNAGGLRGAAQHDRRAIRDWRGVLEQVAVPPLS